MIGGAEDGRVFNPPGLTPDPAPALGGGEAAFLDMRELRIPSGRVAGMSGYELAQVGPGVEIWGEVQHPRRTQPQEVSKFNRSPLKEQ